MNENDLLKNALAQNVVLLAMDAEKEGKELAQQFSVRGYPTFMTLNSDGETLDRWLGYGGPEPFIEVMTASLADPTTIDEKFARYRKEPTEADAQKLADIRSYEGHHAEAVALYKRAMALNPKTDVNYDARIFESMVEGARDELYSVDELKAQADRVINADNGSPMDAVEVAMTMGRFAKKKGDMALYTPYLKAAVSATETTDDEMAIKYRRHLMPDFALHVEKNVDQAVQYRKATLPEGWKEDANQLNGFAWWCFENEVNLDEGEKMARRGIELAQPGNERANIYDTLAEICNLKGDCADAVEIMRLAVADDPENEYFQKQLERFEKLLAEKS